LTESGFMHDIRHDGSHLVRTISFGDRNFVSTLPRPDSDGESPEADWWQAILRGSVPTLASGKPRQEELRVADLFCGSGGFTSGLRLAADALGIKLHVRFAVDTDVEALTTYRANHRPDATSSHSVMDLVDAQIHERGGRWHFYYPPEVVDPVIEPFVGEVDLVVAGPPCQGHSNLNNHTRREDPRNALYPMAAAVAIALGAPAVLIENVPAVLRDRFHSVAITKTLLVDAGWTETDAVLSAARIGWPQTRKRHFLAALQVDRPVDLRVVESTLASDPRSVGWAIGDLLEVDQSNFLDQPSRLSEENEARIKFLFDNDAYTLPNHIRPLKHQDGHTYPSSYGRMNWDAPAGTITTGFMTPGRGRFIHPLLPRALTAHEAARIQGFPDSYVFGDPTAPPTRGLLAKWIGDAVPAPLGYAAAFSVLKAFA